MNIIQILLHLGSIVKTVKDGEQLFSDLVNGKSAGADAVQTLVDLAALVVSGVIPLPSGVTVDEVLKMIDDLKGVL